MTHPHLFVDGKPLPLGKRIGKGGEGEVYIVANDTNRAIKVYTAADGPAREAKIAAMIRMGLAQQTSLVAFPIGVARDQSGHFKGFVMHLVRDHKPIFELYGPGARKQQFPGADYRFLTRAALNTAKAIAAVHKSGCVIGDINHSGILVSKDATVALIDADSFQVIDGTDRYLCRVGVPEFTPPELQGMKLRNVVRTANHDAFGLAIAIFHLLCMGRHPFVGAYTKGEMPLPRAIEEYRFAYSRQRRVDMTPPPGVCTLEDFPPPITAAFETAFGPSGKNARSSAAQWVTLLDGFERTLQKCDKNPLHHYSSAASACPWCRMEQKLHIILFLPKDVGIVVPGWSRDVARWL
jgi:DNA-binding helix-hairpin-helix protein with protein kinase domain